MSKNMFITDRNVTVRSTQGVVVRFRKGEPVYVPPQAQNEVIAVGAHLVDGESGLSDEKEVFSLPTPPAGTERRTSIIEVMRAMMARNQREDFTGAGKPNAMEITKTVGFRVEKGERDELWDKVTHENDEE